MATAQVYAQWIVNNKDKKGTPEFDTVAKAYQIAKQQESQQSQTYDSQGFPMQNGKYQLPIGPSVGEAPQVITPAPQRQPFSLMGEMQGLSEAGLSALTGMIGGPIGTGYGFLKQAGKELAAGQYGTPEAANRIEQTANQYANALTYSPRTPEGQRDVNYLSQIGQYLTPIVPLAETQTLGTLAKPALNQVTGGKQILDPMGGPTPQFSKALEKKGLTYNDLTPEAQKAIPQFTTDRLDTVANQATNVVKNQIKSGARTDSLAPYRVVNNQVVKDPLAESAINQGWEKGTVQMVKTMDGPTKSAARKMLDIRQIIDKNASKAMDMRPTDVIGDELTKRIKFIKDTTNKDRITLDNIAKGLGGKPINTENVIKTLQDSLDNLDVNLTNENGKIKAEFAGSQIVKDKSAQKVINDTIDLLSEDKQPDALRAHKLKRQLDAMIDYRKSSPLKLTPKGEQVVIAVRKSLNDAIRNVSPNYAKVNDRLSMSLDALNNLDKSVGTIDIFGQGADKALGTRMRALLSNQQGRVKIENALDEINNTTQSLGGKFNVNIKDLVQMSNKIDKQFGTTAETSFAGQVAQGTEQALKRGLKHTALDTAAGLAGKGVNVVMGKNPYKAYQTMYKLLNK